MIAHPYLDEVDEWIRVLGWPTLVGIGVWAIRAWDKHQRQMNSIYTNTKDTKAELDLIQTNHLVHLQSGIEAVAKSNDKAVDILQNISTGIAVLVDRTPDRL